MFVVLLSFSVEGAKMLQHIKWLLEEMDEDGSSLFAIHPSFDNLLTSLHTADDVLDAFRLLLLFYKRSKQ
jgi:hypothetical protein